MHTKTNRGKILFLLIVGMTLASGLISCSKDETEKILLEAAQETMEQSEELHGEADIGEADIQKQKSGEMEKIYVYVCGAVKQAGVYELPAGSRVYEAIELAGGLMEEAAAAQINQAEILKDEQQIYVPTQAEAEKQQTLEAEASDGKINLNTAGQEELMSLPGIGKSKADGIIKYREENGPFQTIEDIMLISGIKEGLFNQIRDKIKV